MCIIDRALIFPMVVLPALGVEKSKWILVMSLIAVIALPLTLIEYFFTRERVTEEQSGQSGKTVSIGRQLKLAFSDKYWIILLLYSFTYFFGNNIKNISLLYYCNYVLGTYNDGFTPVSYTHLDVYKRQGECTHKYVYKVVNLFKHFSLPLQNISDLESDPYFIPPPLYRSVPPV